MAKKNTGPSWRSEETKKLLFKALDSGDDIVILDTETTGFSADKERIIQFAAVRCCIKEYKLIFKEVFDIYIKPPYAVSEKIEELTGITNDFLKDKPSEEEAWQSIYSFLGNDVIVAAYNAPFDTQFISRLYERNNEEFRVKISLDVLSMARDIINSRDVQDFKLGTIADHYGHKGKFHNAKDDVNATSKLLQIFISEYLERNKKTENIPEVIKKDAEIISMSYWAGYQGYSRIYVNTTCGGVYYDIRKKVWGEKDTGCMQRINMEKLKADAYELADATNELEFARFRQVNYKRA